MNTHKYKISIFGSAYPNISRKETPAAHTSKQSLEAEALRPLDVNYLDSGALWTAPPGPLCSLLVDMVYYTVQFLVDNTLSATLGSPRQHQLLKHGMTPLLVCKRDFKRQ